MDRVMGAQWWLYVLVLAGMTLAIARSRTRRRTRQIMVWAFGAGIFAAAVIGLIAHALPDRIGPAAGSAGLLCAALAGLIHAKKGRTGQ